MHNILTQTTETIIRNRNNMLMSQHKIHQFLAVCLLSITTSAVAVAATSDNTSAYVDSVHGWGAWELGLEPAAGGPVPAPNHALAARDANVKFRPNDNSAFSPVTGSRAQTTMSPTPLPPATPLPATTTTGTLAPGQPFPTGDPSDRWR